MAPHYQFYIKTLTQFAFLLLPLLILHAKCDIDTYSKIEKEALEKFQKLVGEKTYQEYEGTGLTIMNFLRAKNLNLEEANEMLRKAFEWRQKNNIDSLAEENLFPDLHPALCDGEDKEGDPVCYISPPRWDIRNKILSGKKDELLRFMTQFMERVHKRIMQTRNSTRIGDASHAIYIADAEGYTLRSHACLQCLQLYVEWMIIYEKFYAQDMKRLYVVNIPRVAQPVVSLLRPLMSTHTRRIFKAFSSDKKAELTKELKKYIEPSELLEQYGGTRKRKQ